MPSILHNLVTSGGRKLATLANALKDHASKAAVDAGMEPVAMKRADDFAVTKKAGKKYRFGRRVISYERRGPYQRQIEMHWLHGESWPVMQTYYIHRFLHATKGWREYVGGAALRMPFSPAMPAFPQRFFGRNQRFATNY